MSTPEPSKLTQDEVYDLLSNPRRRYIISQLRQRESPIGLMDLSDQIAAWENQTSVASLTDQQKKRVYVSLYQTHVPKLDNASVIDYDKETGQIRLGENAADLERYLPSPEGASFPWTQLYLQVSVVGALFYLLVVTGAPVFDLIPSVVAGAIVVLSLLLVSVANCLWVRRRTNAVSADLVREWSAPSRGER